MWNSIWFVAIAWLKVQVNLKTLEDSLTGGLTVLLYIYLLFIFIIRKQNTFPRVTTILYSWRTNVRHLIMTRRFLRSPARERQKLYIRSQLLGTVCLLWRYMFTTEPECRDWHEKQHAILETPVSRYSDPTYSAINVLQPYELKREGVEREARELHTGN